jgi:hypothetical protein
MNYQRVYNQIVDRAKQRNLEGYKEKHHIIPKCMGGGNEKENLVELTAREHYICHRLICKIYPENSKLAFAFWAMCNLKNKGQQERYIPNSKTYAEAKEISSKSRSTYLRNYFKTPEGIAALKRRTDSFNYKIKVINTDYTKVVANTDYTARTANTDYTLMVRNTDYKTRAANTDWEARSKKFNKPILQLQRDGTFIKEWNSVKEAGECVKVDSTNISNCLVGRQNTAGGFIWKYKTQE